MNSSTITFLDGKLDNSNPLNDQTHRFPDHGLIMSKGPDPEAIPNFLAEQRDEAPADSQHIFLTIEDLWERKLWHQLTGTLVDYFSQEESAPQRLPIFKTFILTFAEKINQLKFVTLGLSASSQFEGMAFGSFIQVEY
jgi:hypothetical protein